MEKIIKEISCALAELKVPKETAVRTLKQLKEYFGGRRKKIDLPVSIDKLPATAFQRSVWKAMAKIPFGKTVSYGELAKKIGNPKALRAVGSACGKNPLPIIIPCHRVVASGGKLGGFSSGLNIKKKLLKLEKYCRGDPPKADDFLVCRPYTAKFEHGLFIITTHQNNLSKNRDGTVDDRKFCANHLLFSRLVVTELATPSYPSTRPYLFSPKGLRAGEANKNPASRLIKTCQNDALSKRWLP